MLELLQKRARVLALFLISLAPVWDVLSVNCVTYVSLCLFDLLLSSFMFKPSFCFCYFTLFSLLLVLIRKYEIQNIYYCCHLPAVFVSLVLPLHCFVTCLTPSSASVHVVRQSQFKIRFKLQDWLWLSVVPLEFLPTCNLAFNGTLPCC